MQSSIRAAWLRGGTSKGLFLEGSEIERTGRDRDELILELFGSPDNMQIDGIGGSHSVTSKVVLVARSERDDSDIEYLKGQVSIDQPFVSWSNNCGNLSSAVGPFAIDEGLVEADEPITTVRLFNLNTQRQIVAHVPVRSGRAQTNGDYTVAGVPRPGAPILMEWLDPGGPWSGQTFPTGNRADTFEIPGVGPITASLVDITSPTIFVRAQDLGIAGTCQPQDVNGDSTLLDTLESIRLVGADVLGIEEYAQRQRTPLLALVSAPGEGDAAGDVTVVGRVMTMQKMHHAFSITGLICTASAARLEGTVPHGVSREARDGRVVLAHPKGTAEAQIQVDEHSDMKNPVSSATVTRTARRLMDGRVYFRA